MLSLQLYYPHRDLLEISDQMDRYARFGKRIHVTELGFSALPGEGDVGPWGKAAGWRHAPNSPELQAVWLTGSCTVATSKPYCDAITACIGWRQLRLTGSRTTAQLRWPMVLTIDNSRIVCYYTDDRRLTSVARTLATGEP